MLLKQKKSGVLTFEAATTRLNTKGGLATKKEPAYTHLYLASSNHEAAEILFENNYKNILISYFYIRRILRNFDGSIKKWVEHHGWNMKGVRLMLDSGAYSAKTLGKPIPHEEYLEFVAKNLDYISIPIQMDEVLNPEQTEANYKRSLKTGIKFMYCFHRPEPWKFLDRNMPRTDYVGLAPMPKSATSVKLNWFGKALYKAGLRKGKFDYNCVHHLLGSAGKGVLSRMEAVSADSSSWSMAVGVFGTMNTPYGSVCMLENQVGKKQNSWWAQSKEKQANIKKWVESVTKFSMKQMIIKKGTGMNWTKSAGGSCIPLATASMENARAVEKEANKIKADNPELVHTFDKPDFKVCDNEQMSDIKWS